MDKKLSLFDNEKLVLILISLFSIISIVLKQFVDSELYQFFLIPILLIVAFSSKRINLYCLFYFISFYLYFYLLGIEFYNFIVIFLLIKYILFNKVSILSLIPILFICFIEVLNLKSIDLSFIKWMLIISVFFISLLSSKENRNYNQDVAKIYYIFGLGIMALFSIINLWGTQINDSTRVQSGALGTLDQNTYALYCLMGIVLCFNIFFSRNIKSKICHPKLLCMISLVFIFISAILMISKTFILVLIFSLILYIIYLLKKPKYIVPFIFSTSILVLICFQNPFLNSLIQSYINRFNVGGDLAELTTGRTLIYNEYISYLQENILVFFFGKGNFSYNTSIGLSNLPHNMILEMLCSWGLIGTLVLVGILSYMVYRARIVNKCSGVKLIIFFPLLIWLVFMQSLTLLYQGVTWFLLLILLNEIIYFKSKTRGVING